MGKAPEVGLDFDSNGLRPDVDETPDSGVGLVLEFSVEELARVVGDHGGFVVCTAGRQAGHGEGEAKGSSETELHDLYAIPDGFLIADSRKLTAEVRREE